jgi:Tfp pilus assembly protein PilF
MIDKPFGSYESAKKIGYKLFELAVENKSEYFTWVAINNIGIIVRNEGDEETAKLMFLTAHFINRQALAPMQNLANWFSRQGRLEDAQTWIEKILTRYPEWQKNENLVDYFKFEEALNNLRGFEPFKQRVLSQL